MVNMKIICSTSMPFAAEVFGPLGNLQILDPHKITPDVLKMADILICRSTLKVKPALLQGSKVRFVGTGTIGYDHFDTAYLDRQGIAWTAAPGCNANSVAEYVVAALLRLAGRDGFRLRGKTIGIIGVGQVGRRVLKKAEALGLRALLNDPPLFDQTGAACYRPLEEVLAKADIITLHVPLEKAGKYPTFHLADRNFFGRVRKNCVLINAARGAVMNSDDFLKARAAGKIARAVIDCWEGEPAYRRDVLPAADLATPHIAGYSLEGRVMGTVQVYRKLCDFLGRRPQLDLEALLPPAPEIVLPAAGRLAEEALGEIVGRVYDIEADDRALRRSACADAGRRGRRFEKMRQNYPVRREFRFTRVRLPPAAAALAATLRQLDFQVVAE